ncbi:hypothetical protein DU504_16265 [Haloplanus salinus]|uniref:Uncharacterized protein n=1 Tax=Haloplanus salinus TaxID=1126245 RepID=A0A368N4L5_9EURY|nr:hypothetical protein DU504_16265 [Haloplanus salinus]
MALPHREPRRRPRRRASRPHPRLRRVRCDGPGARGQRQRQAGTVLRRTPRRRGPSSQSACWSTLSDTPARIGPRRRPSHRRRRGR